MEIIENINSVVNNFIWGVPAMLCIFGVGLYLSIRTHFLQIRKFPYAIKTTIGRMFRKRNASDGALTPFQAVCTALAATVGTGNIAGVNIPVYEGADFSRGDYDLYSTPLWIDMAADRMEKALSLDLEADVLEEQVRLLAQELRVTTQRVNLFEKVKIPETKANIKKISVYLGDEQVAAVVRSKISKKKLQNEGENA